MTRRRQVAFATNSDFPTGAPDDRTAFAELEALGVDAVPAVWDDPAVRWSELDAVVIRSTWGYDRRSTEFLDWVARTASVTSFYNPPDLVRWNAHKSYLLDLEDDGARIVPTEVVKQGSGRTLASILQEREWHDAVVKPAIGANAVELRTVREHELGVGEEHLRALLARGDALVQPLVAGIQEAGERSLVFLDGKFSHAAAVPHVLAGGPREGEPTVVDATTRAAAEAVVNELPLHPLYARVDFLPAPEGGWWLSELELIEPYLYLRTDPTAPGRFAVAIRARLDGPP